MAVTSRLLSWTVVNETKDLLAQCEIEIGGSPVTVPIYIPMAAIISRRQVYGVATDELALASIIREHTQRMNALPEDPATGNPKQDRMGGLRRDVTIPTTNLAACITDVATTLAAKRAKILAMRHGPPQP
jgi:hypothetical protein